MVLVEAAGATAEATEFNEVTFSDVTNDWNKLGSKSERDRKYEQNVANLRRIAEKFNMKIDLSDL